VEHTVFEEIFIIMLCLPVAIISLIYVLQTLRDVKRIVQCAEFTS